MRILGIIAVVLVFGAVGIMVQRQGKPQSATTAQDLLKPANDAVARHVNDTANQIATEHQNQISKITEKAHADMEKSLDAAQSGQSADK